MAKIEFFYVRKMTQELTLSLEYFDYFLFSTEKQILASLVRHIVQHLQAWEIMALIRPFKMVTHACPKISILGPFFKS